VVIQEHIHLRQRIDSQIFKGSVCIFGPWWCVHRLILVYFSRFVSKEGKQWKDKHSKIGLRCSWEVSKLRYLCDYICSNVGPLMDTWGDWSLRPPTRTNWQLFSDAIEELQSLCMSIDPARKEMVVIPEWKPHWLCRVSNWYLPIRKNWTPGTKYL
jgi:hypothetical protein